MNKKELIGLISEETGLTIRQTKLFVQNLLKTIIETLDSGKSVSLTDRKRLDGFGAFTRKPRKGIYAAKEIPLYWIPCFKPSFAFKQEVDENYTLEEHDPPYKDYVVDSVRELRQSKNKRKKESDDFEEFDNLWT